MFYIRMLIRMPPKSIPLFDAILTSDSAQVKRMIKDGINLNVANERGLPALTFAIYRGNVEVIELLLQHGADINANGVNEALAWAKETNQIRVVDALVTARLQRERQIQ